MNISNRKNNKILIIGSSIVFILLSLFVWILTSNKLDYCTTSYLYQSTSRFLDLVCSNSIAEGVLLPAWLFSAIVAVMSFILLFLKKQIFNSWVKFAILFIILSAIWITFVPSNCGGGWGGFGGCTFDKETVAMFTAGLFLMISILIIAIKSYKLRKKENQIQN